MAYRFKLKQSFDSGARRILLEQLDRAVGLMTAHPDPVVAVHETRKCLKRMRALLRLVRPGLGPESWQRENGALRDAAARLSALRDGDVALQTIARLRIDAPRPLALALDRLAARSRAAAGAAAADSDERRDIVAKTLADLTVCRERLAELSLQGKPRDAVARGLRQAHRRGQARLRAAEAAPTDEALHELRKAIQVHWRQMVLLALAWPEVMRARAGEAREVAGLLGDDHDLAVLAERAEAASGRGLTAAQAQRILTECRQRQEVLRPLVLHRAGRLFAEKPGPFADAVMRSWHSAVAVRQQVRERSDAVHAAARSNGAEPA